MKASKTKRAGAEYAAPQSDSQASDTLAEIGALRRTLGGIDLELAAAVDAIKRDFEERAAPTKARAEAAEAALHAYCDVHRGRLTADGKRKFVDLPAGRVAWRVTPAKVTVRGVDAVMDALRRFGLERFIRLKEEINKEAILAEKDAVASIAGISISQREEIIFEPNSAELAPAGEP